VRSPPLRGGPSRWYPALRDDAPRMRGGRFSRRNALRASACEGRTQAEASHSHRCVYDKPMAKRRGRSGWWYAFLPGVRSPPLRGDRPSMDRLAGKTPGMTRMAVFSEGRGLRVRIARHHGCQELSLPPVARREAGGLIGIHEEGVRRSLPACGARPSYRGGTLAFFFSPPSGYTWR